MNGDENKGINHALRSQVKMKRILTIIDLLFMASRLITKDEYRNSTNEQKHFVLLLGRPCVTVQLYE